MPVKPLRFLGDSRENLSGFSDDLKLDAGQQLWMVQQGLAPSDYKPMPRVGAGVHEIRVSDRDSIARVFYVAKFAEAVYVLHCFEKKSQQTDKRDIEIGQQRYRQMMEDRRR